MLPETLRKDPEVSRGREVSWRYVAECKGGREKMSGREGTDRHQNFCHQGNFCEWWISTPFRVDKTNLRRLVLGPFCVTYRPRIKLY